MDRAEVEPAPRELAKLFDVVGDAGAHAAKRERRADDARKAQLLDDAERLLDRADIAALGHIGADRLHRIAEEQPILGDLDRLDRGADQLDAELGESAVLAERNRQVQCRLAADRGEHGVGPLALDDRREHFRGQRLDVGPIRELGVGHDRRRVAVDEHDLEPLVAKGLARLRAGVVEFARLPDDDGPGADDENAFDISTFGHGENRWLKAQGSRLRQRSPSQDLEGFA